MKPLCAIKPKNENKLFSQSFRHVQKKTHLLLSSSNIFENYNQPLSDRTKNNYSPLQLSLNITTSNGVSPSVQKKMYLTYLNQKSKSIQRGPKTVSQLQRNIYCIPTGSFRLPNSAQFFDLKYQTLSVLKRLPINSPPTTTNPVEIFNKDLFSFQKIVTKLNENDFSRIAKKLMKPTQSSSGGGNDNKSIKIPSLLIHNYYFQNIISYFQREIEYRNQLNQPMTEDEVYLLIKEEFFRIKGKLIQRNKTKYIDEPFKEYKRKLINPEVVTIKKTPMKSIITNNKESEKSSSEYQLLYEKIFKKRSEKRNEVNDLDQYEKTSIDDNNGVIIQPTKNERMKEIKLNESSYEDKVSAQINEGWQSDRKIYNSGAISSLINAQTQTKKGLRDEIALQIKENNSKKKKRAKKQSKLNENSNEVNKEKAITKNSNGKDHKSTGNSQANQLKSESLFKSLFQNKKPTKKSHSTHKQRSSKTLLESNEASPTTHELQNEDRKNNDAEKHGEAIKEDKLEKRRSILKETALKDSKGTTTSNNINNNNNRHSLLFKKLNVTSKSKRLSKRNKTEETKNSKEPLKISREIIEETESGKSSSASYELLTQQNKQNGKIDSSSKDNYTISTIVKTVNNNNINCSLTNLAIEPNKHNRALSNDTQFNTLKSKESGSLIHYSSDKKHPSGLKSPSIVVDFDELYSDYYNRNQSNNNRNLNEEERNVDSQKVGDKVDNRIFISQEELNKMKEHNSTHITNNNNSNNTPSNENWNIPANSKKSKHIASELTSANASKPNEFVRYKENKIKQFNADNNNNNASENFDSTSAKEIIKSLKHSAYQSYYSPTCTQESDSIIKKYQSPLKNVFTSVNQTNNSILKSETEKKYKRKAKYVNNSSQKLKEENEDEIIQSLFVIGNSNTQFSYSNPKRKIAKENLSNAVDFNNDINKDDFIIKRKKLTLDHIINTQNNSNINLFDNISALKSLSPEKFSAQLTNQIDQQINLTSYAIQRSQENRLNDFMLQLKTNKQKKFARRKRKELRFISPIHFRTYFKT